MAELCFDKSVVLMHGIHLPETVFCESSPSQVCGELTMCASCQLHVPCVMFLGHSRSMHTREIRNSLILWIRTSPSIPSFVSEELIFKPWLGFCSESYGNLTCIYFFPSLLILHVHSVFPTHSKSMIYFTNMYFTRLIIISLHPRQKNESWVLM